jgi:hypothetical protein
MNPLDRLLLKSGKTREDFSAKSKLGKIFHRGGVAHTAELERVLALPRYRWQDDQGLEQIGQFLESEFALPPCTCDEDCVCKGAGRMHLRPVQVAALQAIHDFGGMLGPIRVGGGKTLISFLAGSVRGALRVLLLVPAKLQNKTKRDFNLLKKHWKSPRHIKVMSYELLARDRGVKELGEYEPDLIIADEGHKVKNPRAACTKRLRRYLTEHDQCGYVDMSGTITKRSIMEYHHRMNWAIPDGLQALPRKYPEAREWSEALDERTDMPEMRLMPGALFEFCTDEEIKEVAKELQVAPKIRIARAGYCRRLMSAPGVVGTEEQFGGAMPLVIEGVGFEVGREVKRAFELLREEWALPDGQTIDSPATLWRHARELIQGFFYKWDPLPPPAWAEARREWSRMCRDILQRYHDIDSPMIAAREVDKGRIPWAVEALENWRDIKDTFVPVTVTEWIDYRCLEFCEQWARDNCGMIWVNEIAFGDELARRTGLEYYRAKGMSGKKMLEDEKNSCIVSVLANCEGRNLQQFSKNLVVSCPPGGAVWEQMLGRTHRDGQEADEVSVDVIINCYEQLSVFEQARKDAEYIERTTAQCQKLNFADVVLDETKKEGALWEKKNVNFFLDNG